jgi:hypothetical protein
LTSFGDPALFAVELALEPELSMRFLGSEPLGRIRVWVDGKSFGRLDEPSCSFAALLEELATICDDKYVAWHRSLESKIAAAKFQILDDLLFGPNGADRIGSSLDYASFLTNTVECFDGIKGFALTPREGLVQILVSDQAAVFAEALVDKDTLKVILSQLREWVQANRCDA